MPVNFRKLTDCHTIEKGSVNLSYAGGGRQNAWAAQRVYIW
jgi:hypothetical protein